MSEEGSSDSSRKKYKSRHKEERLKIIARKRTIKIKKY